MHARQLLHACNHKSSTRDAPLLLAVDDVAVAVLHRRRAQRRHVAAGVWLRDAEADHLAPLRSDTGERASTHAQHAPWSLVSRMHAARRAAAAQRGEAS